MITIGDKTTTITNTKKVTETIARKALEPRGTFKPLWNIVPDGTITNYSLTTITFDTYNRKNSIIRKNDLAIVTETKPRLMQFLACKIVSEYNRNREKMNQHLLTKKKEAKQTQHSKPPTSSNRGYTNQLERHGSPNNNSQQPQLDISGPSYQQEIPGLSKRKQHHQKRKAQPRKRTQPKTSNFKKKSNEAALAQTKLAKANYHIHQQRQKQLSHSSDSTQFRKNKSIEVINLASDSSQGSPSIIITSNDPDAFTFLTTLSTKKPKNPARTNRKMDKIISKISNSPTKQPRHETELLISIIPADHSTPTEENKAAKRANEPREPIKQKQMTSRWALNNNQRTTTLTDHKQPMQQLTIHQRSVKTQKRLPR